MIEKIYNEITREREAELAGNILAGSFRDLQESGALLDCQQRTAVAVVYRNFFGARQLIKKLDELLNGKDSEIRYAYSEVLAWLNYAALPDFKRGEISIFFQN